MAVSDAFLAAAGKSKIDPVLLLAIESVDALSVSCSTQTDWEASKSLDTDLTTTAVTGSVTVKGALDLDWELLSPSGSLPAVRYGATITPYGTKLYLFGGNNGGTFYNDVWEYDPSANSWLQKTCTGSIPGSRTLHSAWVYNGYLYVAGGNYFYYPGIHGEIIEYPRNDMSRLNLSTFAWETVTQNTALYHANASPVVVGSVVYFFGGMFNFSMDSEIRTFNLLTNTWGVITVSGTKPGRRKNCAIMYYNDSLFVFGGDDVDYSSITDLPPPVIYYTPSSSRPYNDIWKFNVTSGTWVSLEATGTIPSTRTKMGYGQFGPYLICSGGESGGVLLNDSYLYDTRGGTWMQLFTSSMATQQAGRVYGDYYYTFGGSVPSATNAIQRKRVAFIGGSHALQTKTLDLGSAPSINSSIMFDDTVPSGTSMTYSARGSSDGTSWTDLGTITDGSSIAPYRYYDVTATLNVSSNQLYAPILNDIRIISGDAEYRYYSTKSGVPAGTLSEPLISPGISSLSSSLEVMKLGSIGEISPKLFYTKSTFELIRDGYLRNKRVVLKLGLNTQMKEPEYATIFAGLWYDGTIAWKSGQVSVNTRTILNRFKKVSLPKELGGVRSDSTVVPITWSGENCINVMLDVIDQMGVAGRYIDRDTFTALNADSGDPRYGSDWFVTRTLDKDRKSEAIKLLEELSVMSGVFIVQGMDGRLKAKLFDPTAAVAATLDRKFVDFGDVKLNQGDLYTRQHIYYDLISGKAGTSESDYTSSYVYINNTAEVNWGLNADVAPGDPDYQKNPGYQKNWMDAWQISSAARTALAQRMDRWFATPKLSVTASNVPISYFAKPDGTEIEPGDFIGITGLQLPVSGEVWGTPCDNIKFMLTKKTVDLKTCLLTLELKEV